MCGYDLVDLWGGGIELGHAPFDLLSLRARRGELARHPRAKPLVGGRGEIARRVVAVDPFDGLCCLVLLSSWVIEADDDRPPLVFNRVQDLLAGLRCIAATVRHFGVGGVDAMDGDRAPASAGGRAPVVGCGYLLTRAGAAADAESAELGRARGGDGQRDAMDRAMANQGVSSDGAGGCGAVSGSGSP
jgi:hypothetical protein